VIIAATVGATGFPTEGGFTAAFATSAAVLAVGAAVAYRIPRLR
jgi:hypothetical protein